MALPLAARSTVSAEADRSVFSGMAAEIATATSAAAADSPAVLRAARSSSAAFVTGNPTRGAVTPRASAARSAAADAVAAAGGIFGTFATAATGDNNAIDQAIAVLTNIRRATAAEPILESVTVYSAAGAAIKSTGASAGAFGPGAAHEYRKPFSWSNRNARVNATAASCAVPAVSAARAAYDNRKPTNAVRNGKPLPIARVFERPAVGKGVTEAVCRRRGTAVWITRASCKQCSRRTYAERIAQNVSSGYCQLSTTRPSPIAFLHPRASRNLLARRSMYDEPPPPPPPSSP